MKKLLLLLIVFGFAFGRIDYVNTTTNGTNVLTNMLLTAGYLTNVAASSGGGGVSATVVTLRGNAYQKTNITSFLSPSSNSIKSVRAFVDNAPTGSDILIGLTVSGADIWADTNTSLHITNGTTSNTGIAPTQNSNLNIGDPVRVVIHQVGSTTPGGADLLILIEYNYLPFWILIPAVALLFRRRRNGK
jgi:hypothetical protein